MTEVIWLDEAQANLAAEMARGSWLHADIDNELLFGSPADEMWQRFIGKMGIDPESALRKANEKFTMRFTALEQTFEARGQSLQDATLEEMEAEEQAGSAAAPAVEDEPVQPAGAPASRAASSPTTGGMRATR